MQGISRRGDTHIRRLLIQGGKALLRQLDKKTDPRSLWVNRIKNERGSNKAAVAIANKNARIMLALLKSGDNDRKIA